MSLNSTYYKWKGIENYEKLLKIKEGEIYMTIGNVIYNVTGIEDNRTEEEIKKSVNYQLVKIILKTLEKEKEKVSFNG